jgi:hypothetical protein
MATIPGQEYASWTSVPGGNGGLGAVGALYLANKAGLIDLNNKDQMKSVKDNGVLGHLAMKAINGAAQPPANASAMPVKPSVTVGGPMNQTLPQAVPLEPMSSVDDSSIMSSEADPELIDSSLPNFAALLA